MASRVLSCATAPMVSRVLSDSSRTTCCYPSLQKLRSSTSTSTSTVTVTKLRLRNGSIRCKALGESSQTFYQGIYGPWTVDSSDVREVHDFYFFFKSYLSITVFFFFSMCMAMFLCACAGCSIIYIKIVCHSSEVFCGISEMGFFIWFLCPLFFLVTFDDYAVKGVNHSGENIFRRSEMGFLSLLLMIML